MSHECEDCGRTFETLTRLRLHECEDTHEPPAVPTAAESAADRESNVETSGGYEASVAAVDDPLDRVGEGEHGAVHEAVAAFEGGLASALAESGDAYQDVLWEYYEPVSDALDSAARSEGWALLAEVVDAYDPAADESLPLATPAIANAVGRYLIRTRLSAGVEAIEPAALEYLDAVVVSASEYGDVEIEETHAFGWGIGHPDYAFRDRLLDRIEVDIFSTSAVLEHAFYADQHAAVEALGELATATADEGAISHHREGTSTYGRYLLGCVYGPATEGYWSTTPRYYDWHEEFDYTVELDESVEQRVRDLVAELGFDDQLPRDWTLRDLAF